MTSSPENNNEFLSWIGRERELCISPPGGVSKQLPSENNAGLVSGFLTVEMNLDGVYASAAKEDGVNRREEV